MTFSDKVAICSHDAATLRATLADCSRVLLSDRASFMKDEIVRVDGGLLAGVPVRLPD